MGLGQLRGTVLVTSTALHCPYLTTIVARGGLEVCDGGHGLGVMFFLD